jgi:hypothetical protein
VSPAVDESAIREVAGWRDPGGILSVYVDASPDRLTGNPPPVKRAAQAALEQALEASTGAVRNALEERLADLEPTLHALRDPRGHGSGRALFATVEAGDVRAFAFQLPVRDAGCVGARPRLRPLIRSEALGRPAGLVLASRRQVRIVDSRFGDASEVSEITIPAPDEADIWSPRPPGHRGAHTSNAGSQADLRDRRLDRWVAEHLVEPVERLVALASQRGWADLVLAGEVGLIERIAAALPANAPPCILDTRVLEWRGAAAAADDLLPVLERTREERGREIVAEAIDRAAAGGRGAVGDRDVLAALALGRVDHLLVDARDGIDADTLDELVGLAVETDAAVSAFEPLTADGSGARAVAILRW